MSSGVVSFRKYRRQSKDEEDPHVIKARLPASSDMRLYDNMPYKVRAFLESSSEGSSDNDDDATTDSQVNSIGSTLQTNTNKNLHDCNISCLLDQIQNYEDRGAHIFANQVQAWAWEDQADWTIGTLIKRRLKQIKVDAYEIGTNQAIDAATKDIVHGLKRWYAAKKAGQKALSIAVARDM